MATNYPGSLDSYTAKTDGVDVVMAAHVNNMQDAIVAVETELGANAKGGFSSVGAGLAAKLSASGGNLTGDVTANAGVKVDGVDISAHTHTGGAGDAPNLPIASVTNLQSSLDAKLSAAGGNLTGDVTANAGIKVDGVDISAHTHTGGAGDAPNIPIASVTSLQTSLDAKVAKAGDSMTGALAMGNNKVTGLGTPTASDDAATKGYIDGHAQLPSSGEKSALAGTKGTPGSANRYVTETDRTVKRDALKFMDDFIGAKDARWTLGGTGGTYAQNAELGGTGTLATGATSGNAANLTLNAKQCTDKTKSPLMLTRAKLSATTSVGSGLAALFNDANNFIDIFYDSGAGTNFKYRCKNGGTQTVVDSGLAADTAYHAFSISVDNGSGNVTFTIDGANSQNINTNVPTALLEPKIAVNTTENVDKQLTVDYVYLEADR